MSTVYLVSRMASDPVQFLRGVDNCKSVVNLKEIFGVPITTPCMYLSTMNVFKNVLG